MCVKSTQLGRHGESADAGGRREKYIKVFPRGECLWRPEDKHLRVGAFRFYRKLDRLKL